MKTRMEAKDYLKVEFHAREKLLVDMKAKDYLKVEFHAEVKREGIQ